MRALDSPLPAPKRERPVCCRRCLSVTCAPRSSHAEATSLVPKLEAAPFFLATELRRRKILAAMLSLELLPRDAGRVLPSGLSSVNHVGGPAGLEPCASESR